MANATEWTHKGVKITIDHHGDFVGRHRDQALRHPSLDAIKKRIDAMEASAIEPFDAIEWDGNRDTGKIVTLRVTGIGKTTEGRYSKPTFRVDRGGRKSYRNGEEQAVLRDTPENRKALAAYQAAWVFANEEYERLRAIASDLHSAIPYIRADDPTGKAKT